MTNKCPSTLRCQPFAPVFSRQAPADFNTRREGRLKLGNIKADVSDELVRFTQFRSPGPESVLLQMRLGSIDQGIAFFLRQQSREVFHHQRIAIHASERGAITCAPFPQDQPLGSDFRSPIRHFVSSLNA